MPEPEQIDRRQAALIAYDVCRRALTPGDPARQAAMRPVLDAWVKMIAAARAAGLPVIYTTPVSRADGADVVLLPTDLSAETGVLPLTDVVEGTVEAGFPDEIMPQSEDYVFLKRRPSAFYGTGVAELLHMLRRDTMSTTGNGQFANRASRARFPPAQNTTSTRYGPGVANPSASRRLNSSISPARAPGTPIPLARATKSRSG
jgi:isochorismate hydrolase